VIASSPTEGLEVPTRRPRVAVPRSNVTVEVTLSLAESRLVDHGPSVIVRCGELCSHRLFDLRADGFRSVVVTRKCPKCGRRNRGRITCVSGEPLSAPDALNGRWLCECGHYLGSVDEVRGRITVPCRHCKNKARVNVADAMAMADHDSQ
jgi:hypothetical protein